jgi:hypothetical protein
VVYCATFPRVPVSAATFCALSCRAFSSAAFFSRKLRPAETFSVAVFAASFIFKYLIYVIFY